MKGPVAAVLAVTWTIGCGSAPAGPGDGGAWESDGAAPDGELPRSDAGAPPQPDQLEPCASAACWTTALGVSRCLSASVVEDFSTGRYAVHAWSLTAWGGTETTIELERTSGAWDPVLIVALADGETVYDGSVGVDREGLVVSGTSGSGVASVTIASATDRSLQAFVTSAEVAGAGFAGSLPTDAAYVLRLRSECEGTVTVECVVNGHVVEEPACGWLHHIGRAVVPHLEGTRDEALDAAARVGWWSLKEGVLFLANPIVFSNCNTDSGDVRIGPLETCEPGRAWQVGLSAVQVPGRDLAELEAAALRLSPGLGVADVLDGTAREAGLDDATREAVVASDGDLRISWLLRTSLVGFTFQAPRITRECIDSTRDWCYGTGWRETRLFAPDRESALAAVEDVRAILDAVAP